MQPDFSSLSKVEVPGSLKEAYSAGELCLFVGAGISLACGLPDWTSLAQEVVGALPRKGLLPCGGVPLANTSAYDADALLNEKRRILEAMDPLSSMRYVRTDPDYDLNDLVSQCLYRRSIELSEAALEIALLDNVKRICCFNYDDILHRSFDAAGRTFKPLFEAESIPLESPHTLVFYPHGFLPDQNRPSAFEPTKRIVLSEDDYFELYRSPYAWANMVQLTLLLNYTVLFVGCSLLDPNLRRLLDISAKMHKTHRHYAVERCKRPPPTLPNWMQESSLSAHRSVRQQLQSSLCIEVVWIDDYDEITAIFKELRK